MFCRNCGNEIDNLAAVCVKCGVAAGQGTQFCPNCGAKKPAGIPQYKCDKCGWEPQKGATPPRFCPECGDRFDNDDII